MLVNSSKYKPGIILGWLLLNGDLERDLKLDDDKMDAGLLVCTLGACPLTGDLDKDLSIDRKLEDETERLDAGLLSCTADLL